MLKKIRICVKVEDMANDKYNPKYIEPKWQKYWEENPGLYTVKEGKKSEKKYILDMFPYPSGEGLHVGHVESYTATDIISRFLRMQGKKVLHPQGFDSFGLPAENYAIKTKIHPAKTTTEAIKTFTRQLKAMGFSYDWERMVNSSEPDYYKWTQWFFLLLYKNRLAYKKKAKVNWCPSCQTVLANEQVESGACERCGSKVIQKDLEQWFFKITDFIEDKTRTGVSTHVSTSVLTSGLLSGLKKIDWPESTKSLQKNWIGKSEGVVIKFPVIVSEAKQSRTNKNKIATSSAAPRNDSFLEVFTTRLDTIYGCTYCIAAPEHEIISKLKNQISNFKEIEKYIESSKKKSDLMRMEAKIKTGVKIKGIKVINSFTKEELPLWVADYVLAQYGTGAVMAVPAHDERDWEFAKKYKLPIKEVVKPIDNDEIKNSDKAFTEDGLVINSGEYSNLISEEARQKMDDWLEKNKLGERKINYKLRDWLISRQRFWGAPIPIIYCKKCGIVPVPEKDLPIELPDDVDFMPTGESPLALSKKFHNIKCPVCGAKARRESDTMDTFVCSSWYYFRYADPKNEKEFAARDLIKKWLPVDLYVGGAEHSVLHLLYSRFFTKVLHNFGYIDFDEPFTKLRHQGIILAEDGRKMSKSLGNVINPDNEVEKWGADSLRLFEMFMGPLEDMKPWQTNGIVGIYRFFEKIWKLQNKISNKSQSSNDQNSKLLTLVHKTIKKVTEDIENLRFNTAISSLMILVKALEKEHANSASTSLASISGYLCESRRANAPMRIEYYENFLVLLSPFAPHIAEELWNKLGHKESIFKEKWPKYDPKLIKDEEIELIIQINGRVRDKITVSANISETEAKKTAENSEKIKNYIVGKKINKIIFVKGRLINIVI